MKNRREAIKLISTLPLFCSGLVPEILQSIHSEVKPLNTFYDSTSKLSQRNFYKELGVRTFINAAGTSNTFSGSLMVKEVTDTIEYAATEYVKIEELQTKVGNRIAQLLGCESATITSGAFGATSIALAGVMCGLDMNHVNQLPNTQGLKSHVILQSAHKTDRTHALTNTGAKLVLVDTKEDLENSINEHTAMLWFLDDQSNFGSIKHQEFVALGKKWGIPTFIDCSSSLPPAENLFKYTRMGFDLVAFSGGKVLGAPQSTGLLLGKTKYIDAARLHCPPNTTTIARGMKVNKEEVLAFLVALELYLDRDHKKDLVLWENQVQLIYDRIKSLKFLNLQMDVISNSSPVPCLKIGWDEDFLTLTKEEVRQKMRAGHPSIETFGNDHFIGVTTYMMHPGQERIVADRLFSLLKNP